MSFCVVEFTEPEVDVDELTVGDAVIAKVGGIKTVGLPEFKAEFVQLLKACKET